MTRIRCFVGLGALAALLTASVVVVPAAGAASSPIMVLLDGLSSPKGIAVNLDGDPVVAQGAFGPPGEVLVYPLRGRGRGSAFPVTVSANLTDVAVSPLDDTGWGIGPLGPEPDAHVGLFHQLADGTVEMVLDITTYQAADPDPVDQDVPPLPGESNPYGLAVMPNGDALVADAAGNDLLRVTPAGDAMTMARFDVEAVSTDQVPPDFELPPGFELPPTWDAEAVPTSVTIAPDGAVYVGELKGFPFRTGSSHVWRIAPDADGAWCSVNDPDPDCTVHLGGFTAIHDLAFNPTTGRLYVYELAAGGVFPYEAGFATGEFPPAVLLQVKGNGRTELAAGQLSEPGGVVVSPDGKIFVTDGVFSNGRLVRVLS